MENYIMQNCAKLFGERAYGITSYLEKEPMENCASNRLVCI